MIGLEQIPNSFQIIFLISQTLRSITYPIVSDSSHLEVQINKKTRSYNLKKTNPKLGLKITIFQVRGADIDVGRFSRLIRVPGVKLHIPTKFHDSSNNIRGDFLTQMLSQYSKKRISRKIVRLSVCYNLNFTLILHLSNDDI